MARGQDALFRRALQRLMKASSQHRVDFEELLQDLDEPIRRAPWFGGRETLWDLPVNHEGIDQQFAVAPDFSAAVCEAEPSGDSHHLFVTDGRRFSIPDDVADVQDLTFGPNGTIVWSEIAHAGVVTGPAPVRSRVVSVLPGCVRRDDDRGAFCVGSGFHFNRERGLEVLEVVKLNENGAVTVNGIPLYACDGVDAQQACVRVIGGQVFVHNDGKPGPLNMNAMRVIGNVRYDNLLEAALDSVVASPDNWHAMIFGDDGLYLDDGLWLRKSPWQPLDDPKTYGFLSDNTPWAITRSAPSDQRVGNKVAGYFVTRYPVGARRHERRSAQPSWRSVATTLLCDDPVEPLGSKDSRVIVTGTQRRVFIDLNGQQLLMEPRGGMYQAFHDQSGWKLVEAVALQTEPGSSFPVAQIVGRGREQAMRIQHIAMDGDAKTRETWLGHPVRHLSDLTVSRSGHVAAVSTFRGGQCVMLDGYCSCAHEEVAKLRFVCEVSGRGVLCYAALDRVSGGYQWSGQKIKIKG